MGKNKEKEKSDIKGLGPAAEKAPPTKKLSSKLMDMKFMQKARVKEEQEEEQKEQKRLEDDSHWKISSIEKNNNNSDNNKSISKPTVNFSDIMDTGEVSGRRSWGNFNAQPEPEEKKEFQVKEDKEPGKKLKRRSMDNRDDEKNKKRKK